MEEKISSPAARGKTDPVAAIAGVLSAALGLLVLAGWHTGSPRVLTVSPSVAPMAYNTAIAFVWCGLAFIAIGFRRRSAARLTAGVAGCIGFVRLFQYLTGIPQSFETVVSRFTLHHSPVPPVPMAPNTAIGFVLITLAAWLSCIGGQSRRKAAAIASLGAGGAALGLNAFAGYLTGFHTYGWGSFNSMAVDTSAGLMLLGAAAVELSWRDGRRVQTDWRWWTFVLVAMAGTVTSISLWQALAFAERVHLESSTLLRSVLSETVLIFGLVVTALLGAALYLAQTARLRTSLAERLRDEADRALKALGEKERTYRTLLETLPQKLAYKDRESVYVSCNENFASDLNIQPSAIAGRTDHDFFPAALAERYRADDRRVMESGQIAEIEEEYLCHNEKRWVQTVKTPVRDERGTVVGVIIIFWDITDRKRADEAVQRAALYNRSLLEASLDPLVTIASDGKITDVNHAAEAVTGCGRQEMIGADFSNYFTDPERARRGYQQAFREGWVQDYELQIRRSDGHLTPVVYNASVYHDDRGELAGVFAAARDITERKRAEEALQQKIRELGRSNADLEQFAYVASHDLQEPLRMVANFTQLLADRYRDQVGEEGAEFIAYAVDGATRMQRLIEDLLAFSRVGTRGRRFEPVDCNEVLGQAVANLQAAMEECGAFVGHDGLPTIAGDASQLVQLFQNLVGNAIKFRTKAPPRVRVSAARRGDEWVFSVRDNGIGIDPRFADRIFVIFQRLHGRGEYPGTGIGLAVCKKIVERHGGKIWVEPEPGGGAAFLFTIPVA